MSYYTAYAAAQKVSYSLPAKFGYFLGAWVSAWP